MKEIRAVLVGGPEAVPAERRVQRVSPGTEVFKLPHGAGYEHFRRGGESATVDGERAVVFEWVMRTAVAE
ncbi:MULTISPECIES: DUF5988 family protein [Nonomuraea]|jgi:hypothetical protein|uniref:DUF5988 family protein n=2 Tax=Nonomuraea TaxID=83681 RepID=A0ABW1C8W0_9ACTN|nr:MULTISPECIES: DUF5988 family protein [Nonomuraea]MDA0644617.1 DUF5988 family protein [Nonomuraea ferruginea]TXK39191.1 hypothetical protein FR742_05990 [Nonomuraea sp. C10]